MQLFNQGLELSGRATFEALLFAVPGGAEVRAPTLAIRTEEVLADGTRLTEIAEGTRVPQVVPKEPPPALLPHTPPGSFDPHGGPFRTTPMNDMFRGENLPPVPGVARPFPTMVSYLGDAQRAKLQLTVRDGRIYDANGQLADTRGATTTVIGSRPNEAIYVMDSNGNIYASNYQATGRFHHSSLAGGQDVAAAGTIEITDGRIVRITNVSGHYKPGDWQTMQLVENLRAQGYNMHGVEIYDEVTKTTRVLP
jgi:hypothetical protein